MERNDLSYFFIEIIKCNQADIADRLKTVPLQNKIGKDSLPFLEALEKAKEPVPVRLAGGSSPKDIRLSEDALEAVRDMYRLFVLAGGAEEDMLALVDATPLEIY